jgi:hypothetical protein
MGRTPEKEVWTVARAGESSEPHSRKRRLPVLSSRRGRTGGLLNASQSRFDTCGIVEVGQSK